MSIFDVSHDVSQTHQIVFRAASVLAEQFRDKKLSKKVVDNLSNTKNILWKTQVFSWMDSPRLDHIIDYRWTTTHNLVCPGTLQIRGSVRVMHTVHRLIHQKNWRKITTNTQQNHVSAQCVSIFSSGSKQRREEVMTMADLLRLSEVESRLSASRTTVYRLIRAGLIERVFIGDSPRVVDESVDNYIEQLRQTPKSLFGNGDLS